MEFHIKSGSLPQAVAKSFLYTFAVILSYVALFVLFAFSITFKKTSAKSPALLDVLSMLLKGFFLCSSEQPLLFSVFLLGIFASFLFPYFRRHDRLLIDDHGIRFDCRFWPLESWHAAWQDIQLPITYHAPWGQFLNAYAGSLYIQLNRSDDDLPQEKNKWYSFLFIRLGGRLPNNPVFALNRVSAWQTGNEVANKMAGTEADKRPAIIREIERRLSQNAIKRTFFAPFSLSDQARETQRRKRKRRG